MELIRRLEAGATGDCVVTIGSFDGIHLGHRALIERLRAHARRRALPAMMVSFEPLPREFLQAADPPARLTNFRERWRLLATTGIERLCLLRFDQRLRSMSGLEFMALLAAAGARVVVVGHDFRFGRGGEASAQFCAEHARRFGFEVDIVDPVQVGTVRVSSGIIREALARGDFATAQRLLGRPYGMRGRVRMGNRLGRTLGFPTANIAVKRRRVPLDGVFAVRVAGASVAGDASGSEAWQSEQPSIAAPLAAAVANLGTRPMVGGQGMLLEAHLFDFAADLYGRELEVQFVARLRAEQQFESMEALATQMRRDAAEARRILGV
jgi:riboflavin kinase / FMN adenylyltransferase